MNAQVNTQPNPRKDRLEAGSAASADLSNCDREPIHVPGSIQPHGFLLALEGVWSEPAGLIVSHASESAAAFLERPIDRILGHALGELLSAPALARIQKQLRTMKPADSADFLITAQLVDAPNAPFFEVVAFQSGASRILEFELERQSLDMDALNADLYAIISRIPNLGNLAEISSTAARELRRLTGFDRALFYRFDADGTGIVLAEDRNERLPSYHDLRFPASDIPQQARRLYALNRVRIIPDVDYRPSPIRASHAEAASLDLSGSILRSVSSVHREYMRNMETLSSMSISIVLEDRLWGLISLHHRDPRYVPYRLRSSCDLLTRFFATQLAAELKSERLRRTVHLRSVQRGLLTHLATDDRYLYSLTDHPPELLELTHATGAALVLGAECTRVGKTPSEPEVLRLAEWLSRRQERTVFATNSLRGEFRDEFSDAQQWSHAASGVLAVSISNMHASYLIWFRPEVLQTVRWAGEPAKGMREQDGRLEIYPRKSFESWTETVRDKSEPWEDAEIEAAGDLRTAIIQIVLRRAEELADMAAELEFANKELEAFSYSVSHDLRAPFRHISGFSELLKAEESDRLSERGHRYLATIMEAARFAGLLVDTLLSFSRIGRTKIAQNPIDMGAMIHATWADVTAQDAAGRNIEFTVEPMPTVRGDTVLLRQVLINLLSNAVKYTRVRPVAHVRVAGEVRGKEYVFSVHDDGIGFDQKYAHKLFGVFQRLHRPEEYEGTGIGLANVQRIITRHGGRTWAEGEPDKGATFYFTLPVREEGNNAETDSAG